jgi:hypothetical protein
MQFTAQTPAVRAKSTGKAILVVPGPDSIFLQE